MIWKILTFIILACVIIGGTAFPVVENAQAWYEFPLIPELAEKANILFFHVPTAWLSVIAFFVAMVYSIKYLRTRNLNDDIKSYAAIQLGLVFCVLATITGSVWAKFSWGSFWSWDPRETSIFVLLLIYGALLALRSAVEEPDKRARLFSVYAIIAFLTVPFFIFIMPRIMTGLHPGSADDVNAGPVIDFQMTTTMTVLFYLSLTGFTMLFFWMWNLGYRSHIIKDKLSKRFV